MHLLRSPDNVSNKSKAMKVVVVLDLATSKPEMLMVSYCDQPLSVIKRVLSSF